MHFLLFYEKVADHAAREKPHQAAHLEYVVGGVKPGGIVLAGSMDNPADGAAVLLFSCDSAAPVEAFAKGDPYVIHGVVNRWWVRRWHTVVGKDAAEPIRQ
jgi:uncharacterized protein